jgi:hypothetical protein
MSLREKLELRLLALDESIMSFVGPDNLPRLLTGDEPETLVNLLILRCQIRRKCVAMGSRIPEHDPVAAMLREKGIAA